MKNFCLLHRYVRAGFGILALIGVAALGVDPLVVARADASPRLFGLYGHVEVDPNNINVLLDVDVWLQDTGKRGAIAGMFINMDQGFLDPPGVFDAVWNEGYVPFINLMTGSSTAAIANGFNDFAIRNFAFYFAKWAKTGRRAFLAPLPEMNGPWYPYFGPGATFQQAFRHIRQIFEEELAAQEVPSNVASWAFAPNGWNDPRIPENAFENFYPGADVVDIVSINGYNFGGCPGPGSVWDSYDIALKPYLDRLPAMAPGKPLFIAETGTVEVPASGVGNKDQWLQEVFTKLASYPRFRGIVYLNITGTQSTLPACPAGADYRLHVPGTSLWTGFWNAMDTVPNWVYWAPDSQQMAEIAFGRQPAQIFADVLTFHPFALEDGELDFSSWIHALYAAGITQGCAADPLRYCPGNSVTRAEMAVFLLRGMFGNDFTPPPPVGLFGDVPIGPPPAGHPFAAWIEALANAGITSGCGGGNFCPDNPVTRGEMAIFLLRAMGITPPAGSGTGLLFADVLSGHPYVDWIERLFAEGITAGCGGGNFCPNSPVTRDQMAVFLVRAFNLPL